MEDRGSGPVLQQELWVEKPNKFQNGIYEQTYMVRFSAEKAELSDLDHPFQTYVHKRLETRHKWLDKLYWGEKSNEKLAWILHKKS